MDTLNFKWLKSKNKHYSRRYIKAIKYLKSLKRDLELEYGYHIHHIQPKSSGGNDNTNNLIKVTIREHRILHRFLAKATNNKSDWHSAISLNKSKKIKTSKEYEIWKKECSKRMVEKWKDPIYRESQSKSFKGRTPWNKGITFDSDYKQKISEAHIGIKQSKESKEKISKTLKSKAKKYTWKINDSIKYFTVTELIDNCSISRRSAYLLIKDCDKVIKNIQCITNMPISSQGEQAHSS